MMRKSLYPEMIENVPKIKASIPGVCSWMLRVDQRRVGFFEIDTRIQNPPRAHCLRWDSMDKSKFWLTTFSIKNEDEDGIIV